MDNQTKENLAETITREARKPFAVNTDYVALPDGWKLQDIESLLPQPRRKRARVVVTDADSFVDYVIRHGEDDFTTIWCTADYVAGKVSLRAIINDHGKREGEQDWRDHLADYNPVFSEEWKRWTGKNHQIFNQADFAAFIEENLKDVASVPNAPSGSEMLEMALSFEANQDMRFKSAIRLQNGGVQMSFVQDDDSTTLAKMQMFDRFSLGIPVFWNGDAFQIDARLRYRVREGKLTFWYELIRADKILEAAAGTLIEKIKESTGFPFFFGNPGV